MNAPCRLSEHINDLTITRHLTDHRLLHDNARDSCPAQPYKLQHVPLSDLIEQFQPNRREARTLELCEACTPTIIGAQDNVY